jgi:hypothetical protein
LKTNSRVLFLKSKPIWILPITIGSLSGGPAEFRVPVQLDQIPDHLVQAVLEDRADVGVVVGDQDGPRERVHTRDNAPMPLEVTYERDVFRTSDEIKRLMDSLRRFPHGTCTVLHANPYLHAALVDDNRSRQSNLFAGVDVNQHPLGRDQAR